MSRKSFWNTILIMTLPYLKILQWATHWRTVQTWKNSPNSLIFKSQSARIQKYFSNLSPLLHHSLPLPLKSCLPASFSHVQLFSSILSMATPGFQPQTERLPILLPFRCLTANVVCCLNSPQLGRGDFYKQNNLLLLNVCLILSFIFHSDSWYQREKANAELGRK